MSMPRSVSEFMTPATLPLLYNSVEAVDRDMHQNKRRQRSSGYAFAGATHVIPALANESAFACRDLPILLIDDGVEP